MKLYDNCVEAGKAEWPQLFISKVCPFSPGDEERICGDWCPHFHVIYSRVKVASSIKLTCGGQDCLLKLEKEYESN